MIYLLLSRSGPLGNLGLLFTPAAMVLAQAILIMPSATGRGNLACAVALGMILLAITLALNAGAHGGS